MQKLTQQKSGGREILERVECRERDDAPDSNALLRIKPVRKHLSFQTEIFADEI